MTEYRVCLNTQPHRSDYWTVEKAHRSIFGKRWATVRERVGRGFWITKAFTTEDGARAWVLEDRKPITHTCKPA